MTGQTYVPGTASIGRSARATAVMWGAIGLLSAGAAVFTASAGGQGSDSVAVALLRGAIVAAPLAAAAYAWNLVPYRRFARLLFAVGLTALVATLGESSDPVAYTVGRIAGWVLEAELIYLLLAFPTGQPRQRIDDVLAWAMAVVVAVFYVPTLFIAEQLPVPSPWASCVSECPINPLFVLDQEPAFLQAGRLLGAVAVLLVMIGVLARLYRTATAASPLTKQVLLPVIVVGLVRATFVGTVIVAREWFDEAWEIRASAWFIAAATPAIALAFLYGLMRARLHADRVVWQLATRAQDAVDPAALRDELAQAIGDPTIDVVFPVSGQPGSWQDASGRVATLPTAQSGRRAHLVLDGDRTIAVIVHDERLGAQPELLDTVSSLAALALDRQRAEVDRQAAVAATQAERRRIERDLHDGAQQRLIALRIELGLVEPLVATDPERAEHQIRALQGAVEDTLAEIRALAHGAGPPALAARGLEAALQDVAARSPLATTVSTRDLARYTVDVETAVYFCVAEALQNAAKHAVGARLTLVDVRDTGRELLFTVRDDGRTAPRTAITAGEGLTNMRQRVAALDGTLQVSRPPGGGVEVRGAIPLPILFAPVTPGQEVLA